MCKCLQELRERIKESGKYPEAEFDTSFEMNMKTMDMFEKAGKIVVTFKKTKKDGTLSNKKDKVNVLYSYCPLCGEKY